MRSNRPRESSSGFVFKVLLALAILSVASGKVFAEEKSHRGELAATPPMGWNSWNSFGKDINENVVRAAADKMVSFGLKNLGYQYIVIDDHWEGGRDDAGHLLANPKKFPSGIKALADYVHAKGLKLGIYSCAGDKTCGGEVGSFEHEEDDAATFASWGIDYLKYDYCNAPDDLQVAIARYTKMATAIKATEHPMVFSVCEWGVRAPWLWARQAQGQLWRISYDVGDMWVTPDDTHSCIGILTAIESSVNLARYAGPNGWNDPDMLVVGLGNMGSVKGGGCTVAEYQTQMSMWCILAAPLMIGCDIRNMNDEAKNILMNPEAIAIDQDPLGKQGSRVAVGITSVWCKPLTNGELAIGVLNVGDGQATAKINWKDLQLPPNTRFKIRDLWKHQDIGTYTTNFSVKVGSHATVLLRASPVGPGGHSMNEGVASLGAPKQ